MLLGARQFFEKRGGVGWQNPYITDGLIAMWDGEWNAGGGVHDAAATTWKDLTGNNRNLVLYGATPNWSATSCNIRERANIFYLQDGSWFRDCWKAQNGVMVELVVSQSSSSGFVFGCGGQINSWQAWGLCRIADNVSYSLSSWRMGDPKVRAGWKYLSDDCWVIRGWANQTDVEIWNGNDSATGEYTYQDWSQSIISLSVSGHNMSGGSVFPCNYHSIRVYDHKLTSSELAANNSIDQTRFNVQ